MNNNSLPNIPWQERPARSSDVVWRYDANPIIPRNLIPSSNSIFNSAVVPFKGKFAGVFRCDNKKRDMMCIAVSARMALIGIWIMTRLNGNTMTRNSAIFNIATIRVCSGSKTAIMSLGAAPPVRAAAQPVRHTGIFISRKASPTAARFASFISEYFREMTSPCAPPR